MNGKDHTTVIHHLRNKFYKRQLWTEGFRIWEEYEEIKEEFQKQTMVAMEYLSFHSCNPVSSNCDYRIYRIGQLNLLYFLTLAAILVGCLLNCFPCRLALRFSLVVAAYSAGDKALIAALGKLSLIHI